MRVAVTGATGFVGAHTTRALVRHGHEVRALVRDGERLVRAAADLGIDAPEAVVGDMADPRAVDELLAGCDAVVHAAAIYSMDSRRWAETRRTNAAAARNVLGAATRSGCDPIIHISSTVALLRRGATVTPDSPLSQSPGVYIQSKVESDRVARALQDEGAPVVIVAPGGVYGPHDPHLSEAMRQLRDLLRGLYPLWPTGGFFGVDVRDIAQVNAAALKPGLGPRRFIVPGHHLDDSNYFGAVRSATGRRLAHLNVPARMMLPVTRVVAAAQRVMPFHIPAEYEGALIIAHDTRMDASRTERELGVTATDVTQTMTDAIRWLHTAGHISARQAGLAATS